MSSDQDAREARLRKSLTRVALGAVDLRKRPRKPSAKPERRADHIVDCALYVDGVRREGRLPLGGALAAAQDSGGFVWIGLHEPTDEEISGLAKEFNLPALAVDDAVNAHQRPKYERYGELMFLVFKSTKYVEHPVLTVSSEIVETGEVMLFVGTNFVVSVRHGSLGALHRVRSRLETSPQLLRRGPAAVVLCGGRRAGRRASRRGRGPRERRGRDRSGGLRAAGRA